MSVTAKTRITQYGTVDGDFTVGHLPASIESSASVVNVSADYEFYYVVPHIGAIQNPSPYSGMESTYYETTEPDTQWSDSPTNASGLSDSLRFAYGRFGTRYRKLDNYVGVVIHNMDFSHSGDYLTQNHEFNNYSVVRHLESEVSSDLLVENFDMPTSDVTVSQYDFILLASPEPFSYRNSISSDVSIRLSNYTYPLNSGTISLYLDGEQKTSLEVIPFYSGLGGFDAVWYNTQSFDYSEQIDVEWRVFDGDSPPNEFVFKYWFKTVPDNIGPRLSNTSPEDDEVNVEIDTCIEFTLRDYERGVNLNTLEMYVNNQPVLISDMTVTELSTSDGYDFIYCPTEPFLFGDEIPVSIYVEDLADESNYLFSVYSFTTGPSLSPVVIDTNPRACRKFKPITTDVEVDVVGGGHGIDEDSILFSVDDKVVSNPRKLPIIYREE